MTDMTGMRVQRVFAFDRLTVRAADGDQPVRIEGYAAVFNQDSEPISDWWGTSYRERVMPGAFAKTIAEADIRALWNHDPNWVLGRSKSKTLRLHEDEYGLKVEIDLPDTAWASDLAILMQRGDVDQMSIAFQIVKDKWESLRDKESGKRSDLHILLEAKLFDVSVVTFPAFTQTEAKVRALVDAGLDLDKLLAALQAQRTTETPPVEPVPSASLRQSSADHSDNPEPVTPDHSLDVMRMRLEVAKRR